LINPGDTQADLELNPQRAETETVYNDFGAGRFKQSSSGTWKEPRIHIVGAQEFRKPSQVDIQESGVVRERDDMDAVEESENSRGLSRSHERDAYYFIGHFNVSLRLVLTGSCRHFDSCL
jgi:hypothetical protein